MTQRRRLALVFSVLVLFLWGCSVYTSGWAVGTLVLLGELVIAAALIGSIVWAFNGKE